MNAIPVELLAAYRAAHFHVNSEDPFVLLIGEYSRELALLHKAAGVASSAFITACNALGEQCAEEQNTAAQASLLDSVKQLGLASVAGEGRDPQGQWPGEPSLLVLGCSDIQANELGRLYRQNAIVWCEHNAVPELIVLL